MGVISPGSQAQFRAPQPERKTPRAVGVLETFQNGSRRLVPVTFYYERRYYDATLYRATPVPFTLYPETVYEVQHFGKALGTFTVLSATQNASENVAAWFGNGRYKAAPDPALLARKKAAAQRVVLEDRSKPVLHRREGSQGDNPVAHPAPAAPTAEAEEDPERPKLHRREGSGGDAEASAQAPTQAPTETQASAQAAGGEQDSERPKLHRKDDPGDASQAGGQGVSGAASSGMAAPTAVAELTPSDDPEHPILRRGKPAQEQSGRDLPDFHPSGKPGRPGVTGGEEAVTRQVAVSDAGPSEAQALIYVCPEQERELMEAAARELAQAELRRLAAQRGIVLPAPVKPPPAKAAAGAGKKKAAAGSSQAASSQAQTQAAALPELKLEDEQFVPYDLDYNDYATVVFSARYAPPQSASATGANAPGAGAPAPGKSWVVTVIARVDEGKLVKLYSAVSDPRELDLYPEVRLVDAVDPNGYGRYGLLFREQKRDGVSWLLGRTTGYELQTVFETAER